MLLVGELGHSAERISNSDWFINSFIKVVRNSFVQSEFGDQND